MPIFAKTFQITSHIVGKILARNFRLKLVGIFPYVESFELSKIEGEMVQIPIIL
jgi:hypothetical protein